MRGKTNFQTLGIANGQERTIISGAVTLFQSYTILGAETGTEDYLDTINTNGTSEFMPIIFLKAKTGHRITITWNDNIEIRYQITLFDNRYAIFMFNQADNTYSFITTGGGYINQNTLYNPPPPLASWTAIGSPSSNSDSGYGIKLEHAGTGANNVIGYSLAQPATPYTIYAHISTLLRAGNSVFTGIGWRQSSTSELVIFGLYYDTALKWRVAKYTNNTTFSAEYTSGAIVQPVEWLQIQDTGTNRICKISADGQFWTQIHSVGNTDFLTADQNIFVIDATYAAGEASITTLDSWVVEA